MRIDILTLFPGMVQAVLAESILGRAERSGRIEFRVHDIRNYTYDRHRTVDDRPYGGGPGMLLKPEPVFRAVEAISVEEGAAVRRILLTPQGRPFHQDLACELAREDHLILICGHYEGFDERIRTGLEPEEVSVGDFVLTGGELPALVLADAVSRLVPGVVGRAESIESESFMDNRLDFPQYTRPPEFRGMHVPEVLLSGDHAAIDRWRQERSWERTRMRRPDLVPGSTSSVEEASTGKNGEVR